MTFNKLFLIFGLGVCGFVAYANLNGWAVVGGSDTRYNRAGGPVVRGFYHK